MKAITIEEATTNFKYKQEHRRAFQNLFYQRLDGGVIPKMDLDALMEGQKEDKSLYALACKNLIKKYKELNN